MALERGSEREQSGETAREMADLREESLPCYDIWTS